MTREESLVGCLLGGALGDAVGLPVERLRPQRARALFGDMDGPRLLFGRGLISDDTEHAAMTAIALLKSQGDPELFGRALAWQLRGWLLSFPPGAGLATLKASAKLCLGFSAHNSGVDSAGNGPAMRAAILGAWCDELEQLRELVRVSTRITHTDPKAERGACLVALAAHLAARGQNTPDAFLDIISRVLRDDEEMRRLVEAAAHRVESGESTAQFAAAQTWTRGVSGYISHTVPVALHASWRHGDDVRAAILDAVACGGDTDTVAAIVGGIVGAGVSASQLPQDWLRRLTDFPRGVGYLRALGRALANDDLSLAPRLCWPALPLRNALFLSVVLAHAVRRMLPPY